MLTCQNHTHRKRLILSTTSAVGLPIPTAVTTWWISRIWIFASTTTTILYINKTALPLGKGLQARSSISRVKYVSDSGFFIHRLLSYFWVGTSCGRSGLRECFKLTNLPNLCLPSAPPRWIRTCV